MQEALLAFGGNVGDARNTIERAIGQLCDDRDLTVIARSADYSTPPWGVTDQNPFVNLCILAATRLTPDDLLRRIQALEQHFGRNRENERRWGPRTLDIDILAYDDLKLDTPNLTLPHPRLFERAFVLVPLMDIVPDRVIAGRRIRDAAAEVDATGIVKLPPVT
jgi:2-amino-4-hydroxy-6-hydroxymethyldihydropteridine diphosphokinase